MSGFEKALAFHCAPTLLNVKPASLISLSKEKHPGLLLQLGEYYPSFFEKGLRIKLLYECDCRFLLLVYRERALKDHLFSPSMSAFLEEYGYPVKDGFYPLLVHLKGRFTQSGQFPHEIGAFLGYPLDDIRGFILHRGKNYLASGYWKVYADKDESESLFEKYNQCRHFLFSHLSEGKSIIPLIKKAS